MASPLRQRSSLFVENIHNITLAPAEQPLCRNNTILSLLQRSNLFVIKETANFIRSSRFIKHNYCHFLENNPPKIYPDADRLLRWSKDVAVVLGFTNRLCRWHKGICCL